MGASPGGSGSESGSVAVSPSRRRSGFPGLRYRFGAPLHSAPSPSNPSRATAPFQSPPNQGVSPSAEAFRQHTGLPNLQASAERFTSCLPRQPHKPKLLASAATVRSMGVFAHAHDLPRFCHFGWHSLRGLTTPFRYGGLTMASFHFAVDQAASAPVVVRPTAAPAFSFLVSFSI